MTILVALRLYSVGCFLQPLGDLFGISKSSACAVVADVSFLIASKLPPHYIRLTNNPQDIKKGQVKFGSVSFVRVTFVRDLEMNFLRANKSHYEQMSYVRNYKMTRWKVKQAKWL